MTGTTSGLDWGIGYDARSAEMLRPAARVLVDAAGPVAGQQLLDLGAGRGTCPAGGRTERQ